MVDKLGVLLTAFMIILIGVILAGNVADEVEDVSVSSVLQSNESVTLNSTGNDGGEGNNDTAQTHTTALTQATILSLSQVRNSTAQDVTSRCDITLSTRILNCTSTGSTATYVDYNYEPADYVHNSTAATLVRLVTLFFVLAILILGVGFAIGGFKDML